jgi:uncharacterized C2H2 Zn-finger protein
VVVATTDPYRVLGADRTWSLAEIERHYREHIREVHPDRHVHEGPDAVALADQRTRELNEAMAQIRERHGSFAVPGTGGGAGPTTPGANRGGWMGTGTNPSEAWARGDGGTDFGISFGWGAPEQERERTHSSVPQPCPKCGQEFTSRDDFATHVYMVHQTTPAKLAGARSGGRRRRRGKGPQLLAALEWLGFVLSVAGVFLVLAWRASMPPAEAGKLTPVLVVVAIAGVTLAGRLLYNRFFEDKNENRRVKF